MRIFLVALSALLLATPTGTFSRVPEAQQSEEIESVPSEDKPAAGYASIEAMPSESVLVTHYCTCEKCCGKSNGITASGRKAEYGVTIAVDRKKIPLGTTVYADYGDGILHIYRADDVGGAIKGNHIDLCVETHEEALRLGRRTAKIYVEE